MKEYLKMETVFKGELFIDSDCDDVIVDELSLTVLESFGGSDVAKFALHAINSHDELVRTNQELLGILGELLSRGVAYQSAIEKDDYGMDFNEWWARAKVVIAKASD